MADLEMLFLELALLIAWMNHIGSRPWLRFLPWMCHTVVAGRRQSRDTSYDKLLTPSYISCLYWAATSMFLGASYMPPSDTREAISA